MLELKIIDESDIKLIVWFYLNLKEENMPLNNKIYNEKRSKLKDKSIIENNFREDLNNWNYWLILSNWWESIWYILWYDYVDLMKSDIYDVEYKIWVIKNIYLKKEYRWWGNWKLLVDKMTNIFKEKGCEIVELTTNYGWSAEEFYKHIWFSEASIMLCKKI